MPTGSRDMEGVCIKTEPVDDNFDEDISIKMEHGTEHEPLVIIEQGESECLSQKKSHDRVPQRKQLKKSTNASATRIYKTHICDECGKEFRGAYELKCHKMLHSNIRPFVCPVENCGAAYTLNSSLKLHRMSHTGEHKCFCEECGQGFSSKFQMRIHQRAKHNGERPFICADCGQAFIRKKELTRHELQHKGNKPYECQECGMRFYEKLLLRSHEKTHTAGGGKPCICEECGKGFYHQTSLNAHKRSHSTKSFGCEVCGKTFTQKGTLNIHKIIHSGVRFNCEECGLQFTQKYTLKQHRMKQHGLSTALPKQQKIIQTVTVSEPKIVSQKDSILRNGDHSTGPSETSESRATVPTGLVACKSIFPLKDSSELKRATLTTKSEVQQPEETSEMGRSSPLSESEPSSSKNDIMLETNGDESTVFENKFVVEPTIDILQLPSIDGVSTSLDQMKQEIPLFDIWKCVGTTLDEEYQDVSENPTKNHCDRKFEPALQNHQESLDRGKKERTESFACDECGRAFARKHELNAHKRIHSGTAPYSCTQCDRSFIHLGNFKKHQQTHTDDKGRKKVSCVCDECGKVLAGKHHLKIHKRIHSGTMPYSCTECDKSFTQLGNLKLHRLTHSDRERPFACEICGLKFSMKKTLDKHQLTHSDERNFGCDICGKKFKHPGSIKRHKMRHANERNFGCEICGKTFIEKSYIKIHLRTHTGYKPFACDLCPSTFVEKSQLTQHKGHSHRRVGEPSPFRKRKLAKMMKMMDNDLK